jgi:hypothetical protein
LLLLATELRVEAQGYNQARVGRKLPKFMLYIFSVSVSETHQNRAIRNWLRAIFV